MKGLILLLALGAMGLGAYKLASDHAPGLIEELRGFVENKDKETAHSGATRGSIQTISRGEKVDVTKHVDPAGLTVIDFTAPW